MLDNVTKQVESCRLKALFNACISEFAEAIDDGACLLDIVLSPEVLHSLVEILHGVLYHLVKAAHPVLAHLYRLV